MIIDYVWPCIIHGHVTYMMTYHTWHMELSSMTNDYVGNVLNVGSVNMCSLNVHDKSTCMIVTNEK